MSESEISQESENLDPLVGKTLSGRFVLERLLSRGGMGKVYRATQKPLDRTVALKILDVTDSDGEFRRRFFMEASLCAKLSHPHTVRIYDYGATDDGIFFIAMEHLQGRTLHDMVHMDAPVDPLRAIVIMRRICGALAEAHDAGIVHRDLKPANVFLTHHGDDPEFPKVIDFGLVKELGKESELSRTGHVLGSPLYMAPEQVEGRAVDGRTDVYAAGLILYFMLSGKTAFPRGNPMAVLMAQVQRTPKTFAELDSSLEVPAIVEWCVRRCLEKAMDDRFASMHEFLRALKVAEKVLRGEVPGPVDLELEDGRVVLPEALDISEELRMSQLPPSTSLPPPTPLPDSMGPPDTTLLDKQTLPLPEETSRTQVRLLMAGSAVSVALAVLALVVVVLGIAGMYAMSTSSVENPAAVASPAEPHLVQVTSDPPGAEVERDGGLVGTTPLDLATESEAYNVTVKAPGHEPRTVRIGSDQDTVHVPLAASPEPDVEVEPAPVVAPRPSPKVRQPAPAPSPAPRPGSGTDLRDPWAD